MRGSPRSLRPRTRLALRAAAVLALATSADGAVRADPPPAARKNVVVIHEFDPALPVTARLLQGIEAVLDQQGDVNVYSEHLDLYRFDDSLNADYLARWYASKYASKRVDVVIAAGEEALRFLLRVRSTLWSGTPVVFCAAP